MSHRNCELQRRIGAGAEQSVRSSRALADTRSSFWSLPQRECGAVAASRGGPLTALGGPGIQRLLDLGTVPISHTSPHVLAIMNHVIVPGAGSVIRDAPTSTRETECVPGTITGPLGS